MGVFTVERSQKVIQNRFELVVLASQRARDLSVGAKSSLDFSSNDKVVAMALKEIETNVLEVKNLKRLLIRRHKLNVIDFGYSPDPNDVKREGSDKFKHNTNEFADIFFGDSDISTQD